MSSHTNPTRRVSAITELLNQAQTRALADRRIALVSETVRNNLPLELAPEELARSVNLSVSRLRHLFKAVAGVPLAHYIKLLRMERAGDLLATEFLTNKVVLAKVGLKGESHFVREFKAVYGMTPACYRNYYPGNLRSQSEPRTSYVNGAAMAEA